MSSDDREMPSAPNDREAERALLGLMLRDNSLVPMAVEKVRPQSFYQFSHQTIFELIVDLVLKKRVPADPVSLADLAKAEGVVDDIGGYGYIVEIWDAAPSHNAEKYAEIVRGCAIKRAISIIADEIRVAAMEPGSEWSSVVDLAEKRLYGLSAKVRATQTFKIAEKVKEAIDRMERRSEGKESPVVTGWTTMDAVTGGFEAGDLVVVAARPSVGKTAFSVAMMAELGSMGIPGYIVSIEQPIVELVDRLIAANSMVDLHHIRTGEVKDKATEIFDAGDAISQLPLSATEKSDLDIMEIIALMRRRAGAGDKVFMIDYLQLINPEDRKMMREQQVADITKRLKAEARATGMVVVLLAQLNREVAKRSDPKPKMSDLRESGAIEQDADVVMLLHRVEDEQNQLEVIIDKNRKGQTGSVLMVFERRFARFQEWKI